MVHTIFWILVYGFISVTFIALATLAVLIQLQ